MRAIDRVQNSENGCGLEYAGAMRFKRKERYLRTLDDIEDDYFRQHPEEIDEYISLIFEEYAQDGNIGALLASLRVVARAQGITAMTDAAGMTRKGLQKALAAEGNPRFESINAILKALGYRLAPQKLTTPLL